MNVSYATNGDMSSFQPGDIDDSAYRHRVFVYGTLKSGHGNNRLLTFPGAVFTGPAVTDEAAFDLCCGHSFPYALINGEYRIQGELYDVDDNTFRRLDMLEGYPNFYNRTQIKVWGRSAWIYFYPVDENDNRLPGILESPRLSVTDGVKVWD